MSYPAINPLALVKSASPIAPTALVEQMPKL